MYMLVKMIGIWSINISEWIPKMLEISPLVFYLISKISIFIWWNSCCYIASLLIILHNCNFILQYDGSKCVFHVVDTDIWYTGSRILATWLRTVGISVSIKVDEVCSNRQVTSYKHSRCKLSITLVLPGAAENGSSLI